MLMGHGRVRKVNGTKTKMSKVCRGGGNSGSSIVPYFSIWSYSTCQFT